MDRKVEKMNLTKFLIEVDMQLDTMKRDRLINFIHEIARTLPETNRDSFIKKLKDTQEEKKTNHARKSSIVSYVTDF